MQLNTIKPAAGSKQSPKRLGRGIGSGLGKTCGRGHKGQRARKGGFHKLGFEGGQMPIQRRLPKFGFYSRQSADIAEVRLSDLAKVAADVIDIKALKEADIINLAVKKVKVYLAGKIEKSVRLVGIKVTRGARAAIEAAGGSIEE